MEFDSTFWVAIAFVVFIIAVFKPLRGAMTGALDDKIAQIRNEVEEAQRLREEAQSTLASYQLKQRDAAQEVEAMMEQAKAEAKSRRGWHLTAEGRAARAQAELGGVQTGVSAVEAAGEGSRTLQLPKQWSER